MENGEPNILSILFSLALFLNALIFLGIGLYIGMFALFFLWMKLNRHFVERPREEVFEKRFPIGEEMIFQGPYIRKVPLITIHPRYSDGIFWGSRNMRCQLVILYEGGWDWLKDAWAPASMRGEFQKFDLEFRGKITKKGNFGRDGVCRYKIEVLEMFSAHLLNADNALLLRNSDKPEPSADELIRPSKESAQTDPHTLLRPDSSEDDR